MKIQCLLALSSSAVIVAACSSGGSSPAPHPAPTSVAPSAVKHAPNATLTVSLPTNYVRVKSSKSLARTARTARRPSFVDPTSGAVLEVEVSNYSGFSPTTNYMAATNVPVTVSGAANSQAIPIYLAPGYDNVLVQEVAPYEGYLLSNTAGYLLAQGTGYAEVGAGQASGVSVVMQLVLGTTNDVDGTQLSGVAIVDDVTTYSTLYPGFMSLGSSTSLASTCVANSQTLYFVPTDDFGGTYAYQSSTGAGNAQPGIGIPQGKITWTSGGSSTLVSSPFGGFTVSFDSNHEPITITDTFSGVVLDPSTFSNGSLVPNFGPFNFSNPSTVTSQIDESYNYYYLTLNESGESAYCEGDI